MKLRGKIRGLGVMQKKTCRIEGVGIRHEDLVTGGVVKGNPRLERRELVERGCDVRMFDLL